MPKIGVCQRLRRSQTPIFGLFLAVLVTLDCRQ